MEVKELIKQYPELGELLAEYENRLLFLEGSLPLQIEEDETKVVYQDIEFTQRQWDAVNQLKGLTLNIDRRLKELMVVLGVTYDDENGNLVLKRKKKKDII